MADYLPEYNDIAYKLTLLGKTDVELADIFGVCEKTINNWKNQYPLFLQSIKNGKDLADSEVINSLFNRAKGYDYSTSKEVVLDGKVVILTETKHYPADPVSCFFWLKNRQRKIWKDKHDDADNQDKQITVTFK